jgi:hypothetical protein
MQRTFFSRRYFLQLIATGAAVVSLPGLAKGSQKTNNPTVASYEPVIIADSEQVDTAKQNIESLLLDSALKNMKVIDYI